MSNPQLAAIEKLEKQKQVIENRIQQAKNRYQSTEKKRDTRRKILLGAYFLEKFRQEGSLDSIKPELDKFLKRNSDRVLFDLPPLKAKETTEEIA